jgi:hypothetical protein
VCCAVVALWPNDPLAPFGVVLAPYLVAQFSPAAANGGDLVAAVLGLWLALVSLTDWLSRRWPHRSLAAVRSSFVVGTRWQVHLIYAAACVAKIRTPAWRSGHALVRYGADPFFGVAPQATGALHFVASHAALGDGLTWSTMVVEGALALCWLIPDRWRPIAIIAGVVLHLSIGVLLGLGNFALVMFSALACLWPLTASSNRSPLAFARPWTWASHPGGEQP